MKSLLLLFLCAAATTSLGNPTGDFAPGNLQIDERDIKWKVTQNMTTYEAKNYKQLTVRMGVNPYGYTNLSHIFSVS